MHASLQEIFLVYIPDSFRFFIAICSVPIFSATLFADLMVLDSGNNRIVLASSSNGSILNPNWLVDSALQTPVNAIDSGRGTIFVSDQLASLVREYTYPTPGNPATFLGNFVNNTQINNNRGIAVLNNALYVTVAGGTFANTVQRFDLSNGGQSTFINSNLASPWDIAFRANDVLVTNSTDGITRRFDLSGTYLGAFSTTAITNPRQIHFEADGDVTIGNNNGGIVRFDSNGTFQSAFGPSSARGVFQLDNGNYLYGSGINLGIYDVGTNTSNVIGSVSGTGASFQYIEFVDLSAVPEPSSLALVACVGLLGLTRRRTQSLVTKDSAVFV
jgi:hypothetical protein